MHSTMDGETMRRHPDSVFSYRRHIIDGGDMRLKEPGLRLRDLEEQALRYMEEGKLSEALKLRMKGVALARLSLADPTAASVESSAVVAQAHLRLCDNYNQMGFAEQVCWHSQKAMGFCDPGRRTSEFISILVFAYHFMAKGLLLKGDPDCTLRYLEKALLLNHHLHGEEDVTNAPLHLSFSDCYAILDEVPGKCSFSLADQIVTNKGINGDQCSNYEKALGELQKAWQLMDSSENTIEDLDKDNMPWELGSFQVSKADINAKIAQIFAKQGKLWDAAKYYEKAIHCHEATKSTYNTVPISMIKRELDVIYRRVQV